ncbi:hypothetical protein [Bacillus suaedae]|uniref:Lipoprotein n=1 Tax=Halalkalibacter suaedae TaxID=2822140 RepID=A0A940WW07_9BACI|nr:hypothetical protein [Bacillus suaedae]MBP3951617.1 hypothetical protein [Bacillus suaedae]
MGKSFVSILMVILLASCSSSESDLKFVGEGETWLVELSVHQINREETYHIKIFSKMNEKDGIESFHYNIKSKDDVLDYSVNNAILDRNKEYNHKLLSSNSATTTELDELAIVIKWSGTFESFDLNNSN